jgi:hypothetical protein
VVTNVGGIYVRRKIIGNFLTSFPISDNPTPDPSPKREGRFVTQGTSPPAPLLKARGNLVTQDVKNIEVVISKRGGD